MSRARVQPVHKCRRFVPIHIRRRPVARPWPRRHVGHAEAGRFIDHLLRNLVGTHPKRVGHSTVYCENPIAQIIRIAGVAYGYEVDGEMITPVTEGVGVSGKAEGYQTRHQERGRFHLLGALVQ